MSGTNASHSWINQRAFNEVIKKLDFLVVQDMYHTTETARHAHLVLPAAGWGEKEGTFINSERRIGLVKKVARAPGEALSDFNIIKLAAHYWGCGEMFREWTSPEAVFQILKRVSKGQPCDITGIPDYGMLDECGGVQWPWPEKDVKEGETAMPAEESLLTCPRPNSPAGPTARERRLFTDGCFHHLDGKAKFIFEAPREVPEPTDGEYPFTLLTGRGTTAQWHTQTRTSKSDVLRQLYPEKVYVEINPRDAERLRIRANQRVEVASRRGVVAAAAHITSTVQPGMVFIPMHYAVTNQLTLAAFDPYSRQPTYKCCAVKIRPASNGRTDT